MLQDGFGDRLKAFVSGGGVAVGTYFTGWVDKNRLCFLGGFPGDGLSDIFGIISEETDALYPSDRNHIRWKDGRISDVSDIEELLRPGTAEVLAEYADDYLEGLPAVTENSFGKGCAYYISCRTEPAELKELIQAALADAGIAARELCENVEYHVRYGDGKCYEFYLNTGSAPVSLKDVYGTDLVTGTAAKGTFTLEGLCAAVIEKDILFD